MLPSRLLVKSPRCPRIGFNMARPHCCNFSVPVGAGIPMAARAAVSQEGKTHTDTIDRRCPRKVWESIATC